jgi:predicted transcriptional regulator
MLKEELEQKSIEHRKYTKYTKEEILDLLKTLERYKIIEIVNKTRWDQLLKENGNIDEHRILKIIAVDIPQTKRKYSDKVQKDIDDPITEEDAYLAIDLKLLEYYLQIGLTERYYPIYCIIRKMSNLDFKSWMKIETMSKHLGMDKDSINKMIHEMNRKYLLYSRKVKRKDRAGYRFEHFICKNFSEINQFRERFENEINKNIEKWNKVIERKNKKRKQDLVPDFDMLENDESIEATESNNTNWGEDDPFAGYDHHPNSLRYIEQRTEVIEVNLGSKDVHEVF